MPNDERSSPSAGTFSLRALLAAVAILALPMAVMHYYAHGPEWFREIVALGFCLGSLLFVLCAPTLATLAVQLCQRRGRAAVIIVALVIILIVLLAFAAQRLFEATPGP